jgi:stress response protein SCP2
LQKAKADLDEAVAARDPVQLREAIDKAIQVEYPDLAVPQALLDRLENVCHKLDSAKGIDALKIALKLAYQAELPHHIVNVAVERLGTREAAQQALIEAVAAARVSPLVAALNMAQGMHLPFEPEARDKLADFFRAEALLKDAIDRRNMLALRHAIDVAAEVGIREDALIAEADELLRSLQAIQDAALVRLREATEARFPKELSLAISAARTAQAAEAKLEDAEALLRHLRRLLKAIEDSAGVPQRIETLDAAKIVPDPLLEVAKEQLACLKALHAALRRGSVEVLRKALKNAIQVGVKDVETNEGSVIYNEWRLAYHEVEVATAVLRTGRLRRALVEALRVGINEDQLEHATSFLQRFERRDEARENLVAAIEVKNCEQLHRALKAACDTDVIDASLMYKATTLLEHLLQLRAQLSSAVANPELATMYEACLKAREQPSLPEREREVAEQMLVELQRREQEELLADLHHATTTKNFRALDHLCTRAETIVQSGLERVDMEEARALSQIVAENTRLKLEVQLQEERSKKDQSRWTKEVPDCDEALPIPLASVTGDLTIYFGPAGELLTALPREIVEGTLVVSFEESSDMATDLATAEVILRKLRASLKKLLAPEDDVISIAAGIYDDWGRLRRRGSKFIDGKLELHFAIYVRALHTGVAVAEAICEGAQLGRDLWSDIEEDRVALGEVIDVLPPYEENVDVVACNVAVAMSRHVSTTVYAQPLSPPGKTQRTPRRLSEFVRGVQVRQLRRLTVELVWRYPAGLMETLDGACFVFDTELLVDVVDHRSRQSKNRGRSGIDAVRHGGDVIDREERIGKQIIQVRLDLMPNNVTDLFFALSAYNTRDLSRFTNLRATVYDTDTMRELCSCDFGTPGANESLIMCSIYRLPDYLWRARKIGKTCKGSARDYKLVINRLLELGYPRNKSMRLQVPPLLECIRKEFVLKEPVKATSVTLDSGAR